MPPPRVKPGDAGRGDDPAGGGQSEGVRGVVQVAPGAPGLDPGGAGGRVDPDPPQAAEVEHHPAVAGGEHGDAVPATADRQQKVVVLGVPHGGGHVGDVGGPDDHSRVPVVLGVVDRACGVVVRVTGQHDLAVQPGRAGCGDVRGHRNHRPGWSIGIPASTR